MITRIKKSFEDGVNRLKWFSSLLNERVRVELAVFRMMLQADSLEKRRSELVGSIGERTFELRDKGELNVFKDAIVRKALKELEELDTELRALKERVSKIDEPE